jgi:nitroimidazol reductase NimA-like FMN-containing flavoprotein (pyridoxamine 5'-phosphate oxidase superfamily)
MDPQGRRWQRGRVSLAHRPSVESRSVNEEIREKILKLLDQHRIMTIATLRPDGWPQATTVGYANDGLTLYFLCGPDSQKAANLARDNRVSLTIDHDTSQVMEITGLSMAARAQAVVDVSEGEKAMRMLMERYPQQNSVPFTSLPSFAEVRVFRLTPSVISVLDYSKGFGHTDLVIC